MMMGTGKSDWKLVYLAFVIDFWIATFFITGLFAVLLVAGIAFPSALTPSVSRIMGPLILLTIPVVFAEYFWYFHVGRGGQTIGRRIVGLPPKR